MAGVRSGTVILVDPDVRHVGIDLDALSGDLRRLGIGRTMRVPGLARHPELLTGAVKVSGARTAVIVSADLEHPPIAELRMWGEAGGLAPLGVNVVALDILRARRSAVERSAYAVRMVRSAVIALDAPGAAIRRPVGGALSRRALLNGRATTWVPVVNVRTGSCLGTSRCGHCVEACPEGALRIGDDVAGAPPIVDVSRCEACSGCLDVCPTGALSLDGHDPGTIARRLQALLRGATVRLRRPWPSRARPRFHRCIIWVREVGSRVGWCWRSPVSVVWVAFGSSPPWQPAPAPCSSCRASAAWTAAR